MDTLAVDLVVTDDQADVVLDRAQTKIENFASKVEGLNPSLGRRMAVDFELAERRADSVQKKFASIASTRIDAGQFDALTRTAIRAENRANSLRTELEAVRKTAATTSNVSILTQLESQAKGLKAELLRVEALQSKVSPNLPSAGGGGHGLSLSNIANGGQIRGAGPLFRAAGLYQYGIDESILNVANSARAAIGISGTAVAAFGGVAIAGAAVIAISEKIRSDAEKRLQVEEDIAGAFNRQIRGIKEMYESYEKFKHLVESSGDFSSNVSHLVKTGDRGGLQDLLDKADADNKATIDKINSLQKDQLNDEYLLEGAKNRKTHDNIVANRFGDPYTETDKRQDVAHRSAKLEQDKKNLADLAEDLQRGQDKFTQLKQALGQLTDNESDAFDKRWQKFVKDQDEAEKAFQKSVEAGKKKVDEMGKAWISAFDSLAQHTAGDNPFAQFLAKSQTETDKLKESLKGLPPELQKVAFAMKAVADGKDLFSLRIDSVINADNLRFAAKQFTDPTKDERQRGLDADIANFRRSSNSTNPDAFRFFQQRQSDSDNFDRDQRNRLLEEEFRDIYDTRRKGFDLGIADRKFNGLTQGLNAGDLPDDLRRAASDSRLREASRQENLEQDAQIERKKQTAIQVELLDVQKQLLKVTGEGGEKALKVILENETKGAYDAKVTAPTPDDVSADYGSVSGPGGLTNF